MSAPVAARRCGCGSEEVRLYPCGYRCADHTPAKLGGLPEPGGDRYCAPDRCYCGSCPSYVRSLDAIIPTVVDIRAVASGKRRSSLATYRSAQIDMAAQKDRRRR